MTSAQKICEARKCPRCGSHLAPPFVIKATTPIVSEGDEICKHCKLPIKWEQHWVALEKEETQ